MEIKAGFINPWSGKFRLQSDYIKMNVFKKFNKNNKLVVGVGSALVDILVHVDDDFLKQSKAVKGGMALVENSVIRDMISNTPQTPVIVPGGSACNTVVGISKLGGVARFVGKCGNGSMGNIFSKGLQESMVDPHLFSSDSPTGRVLSLVTPDAQRSMLTYLGASAETLPEEISPECFKDAAIVHLEGYLLFNPELIYTALKAAREAGALISLDLASFTVVKESKEILADLIKEFVDILIANEDEALAYTGLTDEISAAKDLALDVKLAVLKTGARGSLIASSDEVLSIPPLPVDSVVDTTGAGDLWAAGFLFGLVNNFTLEKCGALGSACGSEVCQILGATIPQTGWDQINLLLEA